MDKIFIRELRIDTVIGVYDWEREIIQTLLIDLDLAIQIQQAAKTDDLKYTLDYKLICDQVTVLVQTRKAQLIETLAEDIAQFLLNQFPTPWVRVKINKPGAIPQASGVGVQIERGQKPEFC